jgi:hypothetical protein
MFKFNKIRLVIIAALVVMAAARTKDVEENDMPKLHSVRKGNRGRNLVDPQIVNPPPPQPPKAPKKTPPNAP